MTNPTKVYPLSSVTRSLLWTAGLAVGIAWISLAGPDRRLGLYVVHEEMKAGLRLFDTVRFSKIGYIADQPEITITKLISVRDETVEERSTMVRKDGSRDEITDVKTSLVIQLGPEDAVRLQTLTAENAGRRLLLMLGDEPLFAPKIHGEVEAASLRITLPEGVSAESIKRELEKLIYPK